MLTRSILKHLCSLATGSKGGGTGGARGYSPPKNCTVGLSSVHYVLPSAVCKSFSPPNLKMGHVNS